jgi:uroporphyrinogen-III synthase
MAEQLTGLEPQSRDILTLRSEIAKPVLTRMLSDAGHRVRSVVAYRTVGVPVTDRIAEDVRSGRINAILVTSGSVAEQVHAQFPDVPETTLIAAIGPRTAKDAERAGLEVDIVAETQTVDALIDAVARFSLPHAADEFAPKTGMLRLPFAEPQG